MCEGFYAGVYVGVSLNWQDQDDDYQVVAQMTLMIMDTGQDYKIGQ